MSDVDINAFIYNDAPAPEPTGFEDSLNFGSEIPEDDLVTEVPVDPSVIADLLPEQDEIQVQASALESRHNEWSYLRDDIINARGMNQALATEAIALKPNFGNNRPIGYYSRHTSLTRYTTVLEEIDQTMQSDLVRYLENTKERLNRLDDVAVKFTPEMKDNWVNLTSNLAAFGTHFSDAVKLLNEKGEAWIDADVVAKAGENREEYVANSLKNCFTQPAGLLSALVDKDIYYILGQHFSDYLDLLVAHCNAWDNSVEAYIEDVKNAGNNAIPKFNAPEELSIKLPDGSMVKYSELADRLRNEGNNAKTYSSRRETPLTVDNYLFAASAAAQYSGIEGVIDRFNTLKDRIPDYRGMITKLTDLVADYDRFSDQLVLLNEEVNGFATKLFDVYQCFVYIVDEIGNYINDFKSQLLKLIGLVLLLVETKNTELNQMTDPALQDGAPYLPSWNELQAKMMAAVAPNTPTSE